MSKLHVETKIGQKVEFRLYFCLYYEYLITFKTVTYHFPVWFYFIDGYESKHAFTLN